MKPAEYLVAFALTAGYVTGYWVGFWDSTGWVRVWEREKPLTREEIAAAMPPTVRPATGMCQEFYSDAGYNPRLSPGRKRPG